jgi:hypothetical protein
MFRFRLALLALLAVTAQARVISYAPYTDRVATPAVQHRMNRHFVLFENSGQTIQTLLPLPSYNFGQVVLYDSRGVEEPRVIYPQDGSFATVITLAVREDERQIPSILLQLSNASDAIWLFSNNAGSTWIKLQASPGFYPSSLPDHGGPYVRSNNSRIRIGTRDFPFVIALPAVGSTNAALLAIGSDGTIKQLVPANESLLLLGSDREGRRFLLRSVNFTTQHDDVFIVDLDGNQTFVTTRPSYDAEGWITPDGGVYLDQSQNSGRSISYYTGGRETSLARTLASTDMLFAVPTNDYSGAWILSRGTGKPTVLSLHTPAADLVRQWEDVSGPEVEALHPAASGTRVLIQVHRPRQSVDQMMFKDPALAIWHIGDPAPRVYDELFLSETTAKGFVHVDVDAIESGEPFVFDSGGIAQFFPLPISPPVSGGGSDVVQEWGVVRASLAQRLVLPSVGRTQGAFNSNWVTDLTLYNPNDSFVEVTLTWVPMSGQYAKHSPPIGDPYRPTFTLQAHEIRAINDFAKALFGLDSGVGALFITPTVGSSINVTSRTYSTSALGTYGFGMNGIDVFAAASPRFPVTFSGAFQGPNFRTNLTLTDVSGAPAGAILGAAGPSGPSASDITVTGTPTYGQQQINSVGNLLGLTSLDTGALVVQPTRGAAIASVFVIDNRTNDPTFFPPDIPASVMRIIPAIGHIDGANGSRFRSDLYLYNHSAQVKTVTLQAKLWDVPESPTTIPLTLLPHEARTIRDVLLTAFGKTGIARLRFTIQGSSTDTSVRVTSRTYTIDANGGTYGFLMPPLNSFQSGSPGDTLEILGSSLDKRFRTNLGLVDLAAFVSTRQPRVRVEIADDKGTTLDSFETSVPSAGGMQIGDLFRGRGLPESSTSVLIRVTVLDGMVGAYAAMLDNGTNDPTYMAANLAAKK